MYRMFLFSKDLDDLGMIVTRLPIITGLLHRKQTKIGRRRYDLLAYSTDIQYEWCYGFYLEVCVFVFRGTESIHMHQVLVDVPRGLMILQETKHGVVVVAVGTQFTPAERPIGDQC